MPRARKTEGEIDLASKSCRATACVRLSIALWARVPLALNAFVAAPHAVPVLPFKPLTWAGAARVMTVGLMPAIRRPERETPSPIIA